MNIQLDYSKYDIPEHIQRQLEGYILRGERPNSFLSGVLSGDIRSILVADNSAMSSFKNIVRFLDFELLPFMWGSKQKFEKHIVSGYQKVVVVPIESPDNTK